MAKVEIEIDDDVLEAIDKAGYRPVRFGSSNLGDNYLSTSEKGILTSTSKPPMTRLIVEPKPDDSIPFPDWMPQKWQWVAIDKEGCSFCYEQEPDFYCINGKPNCWYNENGTLDLCDIGFDTSWVPEMPNGDWTKAKWRRRK